MSDIGGMFRGIRTALAVSGVLALIVGILILVWPGKTAAVIAVIIAIYAVIAGIVYIVIGIASPTKGGWSRVGHIVLGVLFIVAGILAFSNLSLATAALAVYIGVLVGIMWIVEGVVSLSTLGQVESKVWTVVFAILSIVAGVLLLFSPIWGALVLWWLIGISLILLGIAQIVRAIRSPFRF